MAISTVKAYKSGGFRILTLLYTTTSSISCRSHQSINHQRVCQHTAQDVRVAVSQAKPARHNLKQAVGKTIKLNKEGADNDAKLADLPKYGFPAVATGAGMF